MSESAAVRRGLTIGLTYLSLIPETAQRLTSRQAAIAEPEHGRTVPRSLVR